MHSRIFQISKEPISPDDYVTESDYYDMWFTSTVADYVDSDTDRAEDIRLLREKLRDSCAFGSDDGGEYMIVVDAKKYFEPKYKEFRQLVKKLSGWTLDDFSGTRETNEHTMFDLKDCYYAEFDVYVDWDYWGEPTSLDNFLRLAKPGTKYYFGATIDYHY